LIEAGRCRTSGRSIEEWHKARIANVKSGEADWVTYDDYVPRQGILTPLNRSVCGRSARGCFVGDYDVPLLPLPAEPTEANQTLYR
jgi:hypothetical protein